jgi:hypothetical protein
LRKSFQQISCEILVFKDIFLQCEIVPEGSGLFAIPLVSLSAVWMREGTSLVAHGAQWFTSRREVSLFYIEGNSTEHYAV